MSANYRLRILWATLRFAAERLPVGTVKICEDRLYWTPPIEPVVLANVMLTCVSPADGGRSTILDVSITHQELGASKPWELQQGGGGGGGTTADPLVQTRSYLPEISAPCEYNGGGAGPPREGAAPS